MTGLHVAVKLFCDSASEMTLIQAECI